MEKEVGEMRRHKIVIFALFGFIMVATFALLVIGNKPFKALKASDIADAKGQIFPPGTTITIREREELVSQLNKLVVYGKDDSDETVLGQGAKFHIVLSDGSELKIETSDFFVMINDEKYRSFDGASLTKVVTELLEQEHEEMK